MLPAPTTRRPGRPYRVLYSLLYGRFAWVDRSPDGSLTANSARYAKALGLRTHALREALADLKERGDLDRLIWHHGWFLARPRCPEGFARLAAGPAARTDTLAATTPVTLDVEGSNRV